MDNFELIERYLQDKMSESERSEFESRLASNPDLMNETNVMRDLIIGVESHGLKNAIKGRKIGASQIAATETTKDEKGNGNIVSITKKRSFSFRSLAVAASIAGIFFLGWWIMQPSTNMDDKLFAEAFYTDPGLPTPMSETNNYNFYDAMVDYKMEKYDLALEKWRNVTEGIGADTLAYYRGMASLKSDKLAQAITDLNAIPSTSSFSIKAKWYLVSIHINAGEYKKAKLLIDQLPSTVNPKYEAIKSFLESN